MGRMFSKARPIQTAAVVENMQAHGESDTADITDWLTYRPLAFKSSDSIGQRYSLVINNGGWNGN